MRRALGQDFRFSMEDFYMNTLGGIKGGKKEEDKEGLFRIAVAREKNPLVSLFGAMAPSNIPGKLAVEHALYEKEEPLFASTVFGVRSNDLTRTPDIITEMLDGNLDQDYAAMKGSADARSALNAKKKELAAKLKKAADGEKEAIQEQLAAIEIALKAELSVQVNQPLSYEAIPAGVTFRSRFRLMRATEQEIVLFMHALGRFGATPLLGGRHNHGCGVVSGAWTVKFRPSGGMVMEDAGSVSFRGDFMPAVATGRAGEWMARKLDIADCDFSAALLQPKTGKKPKQ